MVALQNLAQLRGTSVERLRVRGQFVVTGSQMQALERMGRRESQLGRRRARPQVARFALPPLQGTEVAVRIRGGHAYHRLRAFLVALAARFRARLPRAPVAEYALASLALVAVLGLLRLTGARPTALDHARAHLAAGVLAVEAWPAARAPGGPCTVVGFRAGIHAALAVARPRLGQRRAPCATGLLVDRNNAFALLRATITSL